jgi:hypothetical protein
VRRRRRARGARHTHEVRAIRAAGNRGSGRRRVRPIQPGPATGTARRRRSEPYGLIIEPNGLSVNGSVPIAASAPATRRLGAADGRRSPEGFALRRCGKCYVFVLSAVRRLDQGHRSGPRSGGGGRVRPFARRGRSDDWLTSTSSTITCTWTAEATSPSAQPRTLRSNVTPFERALWRGSVRTPPVSTRSATSTSCFLRSIWRWVPIPPCRA